MSRITHNGRDHWSNGTEEQRARFIRDMPMVDYADEHGRRWTLSRVAGFAALVIAYGALFYVAWALLAGAGL